MWAIGVQGPWPFGFFNFSISFFWLFGFLGRNCSQSPSAAALTLSRGQDDSSPFLEYTSVPPRVTGMRWGNSKESVGNIWERVLGDKNNPHGAWPWQSKNQPENMLL
jgi:hypothetical protein